jgi:hypothetical protein
MAADTNAVTRQSQSGYKGFCLFFGLSTAAIVVALLLMALFLL